MGLGATDAFATAWLMRTLAVDKSRVTPLTLHNVDYRRTSIEPVFDMVLTLSRVGQHVA